MSAQESSDAIKPRKVSSAKFPKARHFSYESPERLSELERNFVLDGAVLSRLTNDETGRTNPSLNFGIPQYRSKDDKHCNNLFTTSKSLPKVATSSDKAASCSMLGGVYDRFVEKSEAKRYLREKTDLGAGYTRKLYGGHTTVPTSPPQHGYHGEEGYRKNTPELRRRRSVFNYEDPFEAAMVVSIQQHSRIKSAPATMILMRQKSANIYRSHPGGGRRAATAMPRAGQPVLLPPLRDLAIGPMV